MKSVNSDLAYAHIRKRILNGEYPPGSPLMTKDLSSEIGVSRTPVRDALRQLEADGLVVIRPHLGANVTKMGRKEFRELCELRLALEGHAAALAAVNHSQSDLREIQYALDAMRNLTSSILSSSDEAPFIGDLLREDVRFHIAIMAAAHNALMKAEILRLNMINRVMIGPSIPKQAGKEISDSNRRKVLASHEEIHDAIARRDARAARDAMERHIEDIVEKSIRLIADSDAISPQELSEQELSYSG